MAQTIDPKTGVATSASVFDDIIEALGLRGSAATQGVVRGKLNALVTTGASSPIATNTGWAIINGKLYRNTASVNTNVATPAAATRIDRLVVRLDYTANPETGTLTLIAGAEGGAAPAVTQTDGTTWDLPLYQVSITTGGVITLTDERAYTGDGHVATASIAADAVNGTKIADDSIDSEHIAAGAVDLEHMSANSVDSDQYVDGSIDTAHYAAGSVTAACIANRTRTVFIPATYGYITNTGNPLTRADPRGFLCEDGSKEYILGDWRLPSDYVSDLTIKALVQCGTAPGGQFHYSGLNIYLGANGQAYNTHTDTTANTQIAPTTALNEILSTAVASVAAGDYITCMYYANRNDANDTFTAGELYVKGFLASYTADS